MTAPINNRVRQDSNKIVIIFNDHVLIILVYSIPGTTKRQRGTVGNMFKPPDITTCRDPIEVMCLPHDFLVLTRNRLGKVMILAYDI